MSLGHCALSGSSFTKTMTGLVTREIWTEQTLPTLASSRPLIAAANSELATPLIFLGADCLKALYVSTGPPNKAQAVITVDNVGWSLVSSSVGVINSFRN